MSPRALLLSASLLAACATPRPAPQLECRCEDGCISACHKPQATTYRTVPRASDVPTAPPPTAFEPLDVIAYEPLPTNAAEEIAARHRIDAPVAVFRGNFAREQGDETVVVSATGVAVFADAGARIASLPLDVLTNRDVHAVRLVDERAEVVLHHRRDDRELVSVLRVVGAAIGEVFVAPTTNDVTFVHHGDERAIRRLPAPNAPCADADCVYRWDQWEGVFRLPRRAPTAPRR